MTKRKDIKIKLRKVGGHAKKKPSWNFRQYKKWAKRYNQDFKYWLEKMGETPRDMFPISKNKR